MFKENLEKDQVIARIKFLKDSIESYKRRIKNKPQFCNVAQLTKLIETGEGKLAELEKRLVEIENQEKQLSLLDLVQEESKEKLLELKREELKEAHLKAQQLRSKGWGSQDTPVLEIYFSVIPKIEKEILKLEKEIEVEPVEPIVIEPIKPIKIESPEPIKIDSPKVKVYKNKKVVLKSKTIPKTKSDKLPDQIKDPVGWWLKRGLRFGASDFSVFTKYVKNLPEHLYKAIHKIPKEFPIENIEAMEIGNFIEGRTHQKLAESLKENGKATLGEFEFSEVYLTKNRQYYNKKEGRLGSQVDAWGVLDGEKTVIEIKSTEQFSFERIKKAFSFDLSLEEKQEVLNEVCPDYYHQVQAQLFCTNSNQAVIHIVNRNRYETLTFLINRDEKAIAWCLEIVDHFFKAKELYRDSSQERIKEQFKINNLGFNLDFPCLSVLKGLLEEIEFKGIEEVKSFIKQNQKIEVFLNDLLGLIKEEKKLEAKLTKLGFKDEQRKIYKKHLMGVAV